MADIDKIVRESVKKLVPYSCARDEFQGREGIFLDANENPYGGLNRYPDPYQKELKIAVSKIKGIGEENIFLGNGSDEIIDLCFRTFCNPGSDCALTFYPSYGMYEVSAAINAVRLIKVPLTDDFSIDPGSIRELLTAPDLKLILICSPNNPTGNSMKRSDIEYIISNFSGIVLIDEAYIDFSEQESFRFLTGKYNNLIVMQTFSKAFGLAAARIGMAFADRTIINYLNKMKPPYNISSLNQKAALKSLGRINLLKKRIRKIKTERERLISDLKKLNIIERVFPSDSNFILVKTRNADEIYARLINSRIIVRNRSRIVPGCLRITVGRKSENTRLLKALSKINL
jgi:histidinol-phosphate aminotransferase